MNSAALSTASSAASIIPINAGTREDIGDDVKNDIDIRVARQTGESDRVIR